jgi:hypothetical protein
MTSAAMTPTSSGNVYNGSIMNMDENDTGVVKNGQKIWLP